MNLKEKSPRKKRSLRGATLLELILSLGILLILFSLGYETLREVLKLYTLSNEILKEERILSALESHLQQILDDSDSHPFSGLIKVHPSGRLELFNKAPYSLKNTPKYLPDKDSNGISVAALNLRATLVVHEILSSSFQSVTLKVCARYPNESVDLPPVNQRASYLAFTTFGIYEFQGERTNMSPIDKCTILRLVRTEGVLTPLAEVEELLAIRLVVPVTRLYTIYLTEEKEVRFLGHRGDEIIENQPLFTVRDLDVLKIHLRERHNLSTLHLNLQTKKRERQRSYISRVRKVAPTNFLLNG